MTSPILYIFSGLPGSGKSTLAKALARVTKASYLRIDTVEQGIRDLCQFKVEGEGYRLSYRVASDNLELGNSVIADSCNPIELTRKEWQDVANNLNAQFINIEVRCSDKTEHKQRVEERVSEVTNLVLPSWQQVVDREYHPWNSNSINLVKIDTAGKSIQESIEELLQLLKAHQR